MCKTPDELHGHPMIGNSWEGFTIEQIIGILPQDWQPFFYRTGAGAEIDLIIAASGKTPIAFEIKYSSRPKPGRGFWIALEDLKCRKGYVVYPGTESYPLAKNVFTLPTADIEKIVSDLKT